MLDEDRETVGTDISHGRTADIVIEANFNEKRYEDEIILLVGLQCVRAVTFFTTTQAVIKRSKLFTINT